VVFVRVNEALTFPLCCSFSLIGSQSSPPIVPFSTPCERTPLPHQDLKREERRPPPPLSRSDGPLSFNLFHPSPFLFEDFSFSPQIENDRGPFFPLDGGGAPFGRREIGYGPFFPGPLAQNLPLPLQGQRERLPVTDAFLTPRKSSPLTLPFGPTMLPFPNKRRSPIPPDPPERRGPLPFALEAEFSSFERFHRLWFPFLFLRLSSLTSRNPRNFFERLKIASSEKTRTKTSPFSPPPPPPTQFLPHCPLGRDDSVFFSSRCKVVFLFSRALPPSPLLPLVVSGAANSLRGPLSKS